MRKLVPVLAIVLTLSATACGGDAGEGTDGDGGTNGATASAGATGPTASTGATGTGGDGCVDLTGEGPVFTIRMEKVAFVPDCFTASASQGISVVNEDPVLHSFTLEGTPIDVDIEADVTFNGEPISGVVAPGTYELICKYHASMTGEVTVVE